MKAILLGLALMTAAAVGAGPVKLEKLSIGTREFSAVTITAKDATRATVMHAGGVATVALSDLPEDVRERLGVERGAKDGAGKKIEGAFGLKFGEVFDLKTAESVKKEAAGGLICDFKSSKPFEGYQGCLVVITPKSRRIYGIVTGRTFATAEEAREERARLLKLLEAKYGKALPENPKFPDYRTIQTGGRTVTIGGNTPGGAHVGLGYTDKDLGATAQSERKAIDAAEADASGL